MRIVSLLPSATEMVYALGLEDGLVGVTQECDYPPSARRKPCISRPSLRLAGASPRAIDGLVSDVVAAGEPLYAIDERRIGELQPDLILAQDLCRVCAVPSGQVAAALDKLGCRARVISLDPTTVDEILDGLLVLGRATGREGRASDVVASLRARVRSVATRTSSLPVSAVFAMEWLDPPFAGGHWIPEMVRLAGGLDVAGGEGKPSRHVAWSDIANASPEVVIYMPCGYGLAEAARQAHALFDIAEFRSTPAARGNKVFAVDASSYFSRPGPRIVDGLEILAWALHPEEFPEPPAGRVIRVG